MALTDVRVWDGTQFVSIKGPKGDQGSPGSAASVQVGAVTEGPLQVTNSGTATSAVLDFRIPKGADGQAATISVGSAVAGAPGSQPIVQNVGTSSAAVLNFAIPQGAKGDPGKDGTGVSIKGTATSWPPAASPTAGDMYIVGNPVPTGAPAGSKPGDGVVWTGSAWTNVGAIQGPPGEKGENGTAATISVGTAVGLPAGQNPIVQNGGTANNAVLNFAIPAGAKGDPGTPGRNAEVYSQANQPTPIGAGAIWLVTTP